jgi:uncharacterized protein (TIGR04255 family)
LPEIAAEPTVFDAEPADVSRVRRNFIDSAVCELRFPILLELYDKPPADLQRVLRSSYPRYERKWEITLEEGGIPQKNPRYVLTSADMHWNVVIKPEGIALETVRYTRFTEFRDRLELLISTAREHLDFDFFTRIGLRYINLFPCSASAVRDWVNASLIAPLESFPAPTRFKQEIRGRFQEGAYGYTLRHGIEPEDRQAYILDLDLAAENVELEKLEAALADLKRASNSLFFWSIGPEALRHLEMPQ